MYLFSSISNIKVLVAFRVSFFALMNVHIIVCHVSVCIIHAYVISDTPLSQPLLCSSEGMARCFSTTTDHDPPDGGLCQTYRRHVDEGLSIP